MISILSPYESLRASTLVAAAFRRSVSVDQVRTIPISSLSTADAVVAIDLPDAWCESLIDWWDDARSRVKLILLGRVPHSLLKRMGWTHMDLPAHFDASVKSAPAPSGQWRESPATVQYLPRAKQLGADQWNRPFERFDFTDEWNNLGYGAIRRDGSCWSLSGGVDTGVDEIAGVFVEDQRVSSYAALADNSSSSILWINRTVGLIDSFEWRVIENFVSAYRSELLPCQPVLREVPWGYDAAVTSRLDCDEDVESSRPLWTLYKDLGVPFTLAVHSTNLTDARHFPILQELVEQGGAVLSHTATHAPNWGGSYEAAYTEGKESSRAIEKVIGHAVRYAVSPFHQTPDYALHGLCDAGYSGCIGGIIRNDPEFVLARGGYLAGLPQGFVGHSQQCMMHGDCMVEGEDPLLIFKQAFDQSRSVFSLFGYLDHPFSPRYAYGWNDEISRTSAHRQLIEYIRSQCEKPLFLHEEDAMDFLQFKSKTQVRRHDDYYFVECPDAVSSLGVAVEYKGGVQQACAFRGPL